MNVLMISNNKIGCDNPELGEILLKSFISTLVEKNTYDYICLLNSGVKIIGEGSTIIEDLKIIDQTTPILACGTCLNYYKLADKVQVGKISNMNIISKLIQIADKVVNI